MINDLELRIDRLRHRHVLVLGDLILDSYTWGNAERVSPEAPVLVLNADEQEVRPGGAASVALLLRHLDARVSLCGVVGDDVAGRTLLKTLEDEGVEHDLVQEVTGRPTTTKERFVGRAVHRHAHQILRVDRETRDEIDHETVACLRDGILRRMSKFSVIIISDYAKGVCTHDLLRSVINGARDYQVPVVVDPARVADYSRYRRASLITPNRSEAERATGICIELPEDALEAGRQLVERASLGGVFVTIDRDGIAVIEGAGDEGSQEVVPAVAREVYDITGAGDMVIAVSGLCQADHWSLCETAALANIAAGLEIEQLGIAPITWDQILRRFAETHERQHKSTGIQVEHSQQGRRNKKTVTLTDLVSRVAEHRTSGKSIVFTNGCFDLLHVGHVTCLEEAAQLGDVLIVAVNSDAGVRRVKGPERPVIPQADRAAMLAALACVDYVLIFDDLTPHIALDCLRPDVLVKGGTTDELIGREIVEAYGGAVVTTEVSAEISTSQIISRICETSHPEFA